MSAIVLKEPTNRLPKPRTFITISRNNLTVTEAKVLNFFTHKHFWGAERNSNYKPATLDLFANIATQGEYITTIAEIRKNINFKNRSPQRLIDSLKALAKKSIEYDVFAYNSENINIEKSKEGVINFFDFVEIQTPAKGRDRIVYYSLGKKFLQTIERMKNKKEQFYYLNYPILSSFTSKYGLALYELLRLYEHLPDIPKLEINQNLLEFFGASKKYKNNMNDFKKRVLEPAVKQIAELSGKVIEYEIKNENNKKYLHLKQQHKGNFELFYYVASELMNSVSNPIAYAKKLISEYDQGKIDQNILEKWKKSFEISQNSKKLIEIREKFLNEVIEAFKKIGVSNLHKNEIYIKVGSGNTTKELELYKLDIYEDNHPNIVEYCYTLFLKSDKKKFISNYISLRGESKAALIEHQRKVA